MALEKGQQIYGMKISFLLKESDGIATYRVRDTNGLLKVLKHGATESERRYAPLSFLYADTGADYVVYRHINGETLDKRLRRMACLDKEEATMLTLDILRQLTVFHKDGLTYRNLTPDNILIEVHGERPTAYLCGLSKLVPVGEDVKEIGTMATNGNKSQNEEVGTTDNEHDKYQVENSETTSEDSQGEKKCSNTNSSLKAVQSTESKSADFKKDLEDVASMIELMLEGSDKDLRVKAKVNVDGSGEESLLEKVMNNAFAHGFDTAQDMIDALEGKAFKAVKLSKAATEKKEGRGFSVVAGMEELKEQLRLEVIDVLADKEGAKEYGIDIPNGMLLYGPPGCGKTFIAARFAEETGYNYKYVKSSDLASVYIHGAQEKIAQLFEEARQQAPTILCFDEFDALVPSRNDVNNTSLRSEVNEFLTQLDNCGKDNVFVIATSNRPDKIDSAILRTGRIDYIIYVPVPDTQARKEIFKMHVSNRPHTKDLDYQVLADLTEGYVASDIATAVQQAARKAFKDKSLITMELLRMVMAQRSPSLSKETITEYEQLRKQFENKTDSTNRRPIGFF